ncbi:S1 family peptidase [Haliovirga abyssi]|uniref:Serine protease n=1 Tax=Haliovirga abyssi TaxID=2996794 RepID=A0AAU9DDE9_9FUSO|nr:serine protease [Haliovirga abyssi]BDU51546.1 serine protease [Haliovirga abyssi]
MKKIAVALILLFTVIGCSSTKIKENSNQKTLILDKKIISKINKSVYEVLVKKVEVKGFKYEKELPVKKLSYSNRNDKYYSIGTAFAIGENKFMTAGHVLALDKKTFFKDFFIRDKNKKVYKIDKVYKYSSNKDFAVFSVKGDVKNEDFLTIKEKFNINQPVFTVGNALGDGIVIRNGVLTSTTPETENGKWNWIRFSAPASPGNSGGPLVDKDGNIIGIILMKSKNENLNYALPILETMKFFDNSLVIHKKIGYGFYNYDKTVNKYYDFKEKLPKSINEIRRDITEDYHKEYIENLDAIYKKNKKDFFPNGENSLKIIYDEYTNRFPYVLAKADNGEWKAFTPKKIEKNELPNESLIQYGQLYDFNMIYFKKPNNIKEKDILDNPTKMLNLALKGLPLYRNFAGEDIRITSVDKQPVSSNYIDAYGRKWIFNTWDLVYNDLQLTTMILPTPSGFVGLSMMGTVDDTYNLKYDFKMISNFVLVSYDGTLKDWKEFLTLKDILQKNLVGLKLDYSKKDNLNLSTGNVSIKYQNKIPIKIDEDSYLLVISNFIKNKENVKLGIKGIYVSENENSNNAFYLLENLRPDDRLDKDYKNSWGKIVDNKYPFDNEVYMNDGQTRIVTTIKNNKNKIYSLSFYLEGKQDENEIKNMMNEFKSNLQIKKEMK